MMATVENPIDICVGIDHAEAGRKIARHIIKKGYRKYGYIGWNDRDYSAAMRYMAFCQEVEKVGGTIIAPDLFERPPNFAAGKRGMKLLLQKSTDLDAVFFPNDTAATGGFVYCLEQGISIPEDLAIAGFSGLETGQHMPKALTTIQTPRYETGRLSARTILNRLAGQKGEQIWDLKFDLIKGETT